MITSSEKYGLESKFSVERTALNDFRLLALGFFFAMVEALHVDAQLDSNCIPDAELEPENSEIPTWDCGLLVSVFRNPAENPREFLADKKSQFSSLSHRKHEYRYFREL